MTSSIIVIGDEILIGQVIDTNSGDIARMLNPCGWRVNDVQVVGDDATQILRAIERAFESSDVVLTTGGLGPTKDDITKSTLCQYFGGELYENADVLENVKEVAGAITPVPGGVGLLTRLAMLHNIIEAAGIF